MSLLKEGFYQVLRPKMAKCSLIPPGFLAIDSRIPWFFWIYATIRYLNLVAFGDGDNRRSIVPIERIWIITALELVYRS